MTASKKGNAMVEATFVIPLIILSVVTIIAICITMYGHAHDSVCLHTGILSESGRESGTFSISPEPGDMPVINKSGKKVSGTKISGTYAGGFMSRKRALSSSDAKVINEKEYIRKWDNVRVE